jgi:hypothetical protein
MAQPPIKNLQVVGLKENTPEWKPASQRQRTAGGCGRWRWRGRRGGGAEIWRPTEPQGGGGGIWRQCGRGGGGILLCGEVVVRVVFVTLVSTASSFGRRRRASGRNAWPSSRLENPSTRRASWVSLGLTLLNTGLPNRLWSVFSSNGLGR